MNQHIAKQFVAELEAVRARVLQMGGIVEQQITSAIEVLSTGNIEQCDRIIEADHRVNGLEIEIESCTRTNLLHDDDDDDDGVGGHKNSSVKPPTSFIFC